MFFREIALINSHYYYYYFSFITAFISWCLLSYIDLMEFTRFLRDLAHGV